MMETTRRHFLKGFAGCLVIVAAPLEIVAAYKDEVYTRGARWIDSVKAPDGWTYQWIRSSLLGEPDTANLEWRLSKGWTFVSPADHPDLPRSDIDDAIEQGGLVLMQKPTAQVEMGRAMERQAAIDQMRMAAVPAREYPLGDTTEDEFGGE